MKSERPADVFRMFAGHGIRLVLLGGTLGAAGAAAVISVIKTMLFRVAPADPAAIAGTAALLIFATALACYIPARRAAEVDPVEALRAE